MSNWEDAKRAAQSPFHDEPATDANKEPRPVSHLSAMTIQSSTALREIAAAMYEPTSHMSLEQSFIVAPDNAPEWVYDREELWNRAELAGQERNAPIARAVTLALPHELSEEGRVQLVKKIAEDFAKQGMMADAAIRYPNSLGDDLSPYARILLTTRELDGETFAAQQQRSWNNPEALQAWRQSWTEYQNDALKETQPHDSLTAFRKEPSQGIVPMTDTEWQPLTEHQALALAINALQQVPDLQPELMFDLQEAYERGKTQNRLTEIAPELYDCIQRFVGEADRNPFNSIGHIVEHVIPARELIAKVTPEQQPARELSAPEPERDRDLEPDL